MQCFFRYIWYVKKRDFDQKNIENTEDTTMDPNGNAGEAATSKIEGEISKVLPNDLITADTEKEVRDWLIIAIVVSIVSVIILLILLVLRKRIKLVVQLFKEAGKAVQCMPFILIQPFWVRKQYRTNDFLSYVSYIHYIHVYICIPDFFVPGHLGIFVDSSISLHRNCGNSRNQPQRICKIRQESILVLDPFVPPFRSALVGKFHRGLSAYGHCWSSGRMVLHSRQVRPKVADFGQF